jgi:hypothetical protein
MNSPALGMSIAALVAALATIYLWPSKTSEHAAVTPLNALRARAVAPSASGSSESVSSTIDYKNLLAESSDYWAYAHNILPAAIAGNADAQFYLSTVIDRCSMDNKMYFQRRGVTLAVDQGLQWALQRHLSIDVAQAVYDRCHKFLESDARDLGSADDWLARATAAGQPLAQATTALRLFTQQTLQSAQGAGGAPNPDAPPRIDSQQDPRQLLRAAVESRDPEVLFSIGAAQGYLDAQNPDPTLSQFAWWLVACERGLDCSANAEWVKIACVHDPRCASFTVPSDLVRTLSGDDWRNVEQLAHEISAKLDAGQWDELNIEDHQ